MVSNKLFNECLWTPVDDACDIGCLFHPVSRTALRVDAMHKAIDAIHAECYPVA